MGGTGGTRAAVAAGLVLAGVAAAPSAGWAAAPPAPGVVYAGETPQHEVVTAEVTPARNRVTKFVFSWSADCLLGPAATPATSTFTYWKELYRGGFAIKPNGRWASNFRETGVEIGIVRSFSYRLSGVRSLTSMTGTIRVVMTERDPMGQVIRTCDSKPIRYTALEPGRFGGLTVGPRDPVLVRLNLPGTRIQRIRWNWSGTCIAGPGATAATELTTYQLEFIDRSIGIKPNGAFRKTLAYAPIPDTTTGLARTFDEKVVGRKTGRTITGTLTARFIDTQIATGSIVRICKSAVRFTAKD